jgi:hypothetical protein
MTVDPGVALAGVSIIATVVGFIAQWLREGRDRKWALQDAARKQTAIAVVKEDAEKAATVIAAKAGEHAEKISTEVHQTAAAIAVKVEASTSAAKEAYTEANTVNHKIAELSSSVENLNKQLLDLSEHVRHKRPRRRRS